MDFSTLWFVIYTAISIPGVLSLQCYTCQHYAVENDDLFKTELENTAFNEKKCDYEGEAIRNATGLKPVDCQIPPPGHTSVCIKVSADTKGEFHNIHDIELRSMLRGCSFIKDNDLLLDSCQEEGVKVVGAMNQLGWSHPDPTEVLEGRACWCSDNRCNHGNKTPLIAINVIIAVAVGIILNNLM